MMMYMNGFKLFYFTQWTDVPAFLSFFLSFFDEIFEESGIRDGV